MDGVADVCDGDTIPQNDSILKIWRLSWFLGINTDKIQCSPNTSTKYSWLSFMLQEMTSLCGPLASLSTSSKLIINLLVDIKAWQVNPSFGNNIDKRIGSGVFSEDHLRVVCLYSWRKVLTIFSSSPGTITSLPSVPMEMTRPR